MPSKDNNALLWDQTHHLLVNWKKTCCNIEHLKNEKTIEVNLVL